MNSDMPPLQEPLNLTSLTPSHNHSIGCHWIAHFKNIELRSAFQPILSLSHQRIVGYEALVRPFTESNIAQNPSDLFAQPCNERENLQLDRLCRYLHLKNFTALQDDVNWLFINVSPKTIDAENIYDSFFGKLIKHLNFPSHRVVVEIVEHASSNTQQLINSVNYYKELGCLTAIDDFGAGHSNFERIWALKPDIVKLDQSMISRAHQDKRIRHMLKGIVSLLHEAGCMVLMEGVETEAQALIAVDSEVDFVQGFYFAIPSPPLINNGKKMDLTTLMKHYKSLRQQNENPRHKVIQHFSVLFEETINRLGIGDSFESSAARLVGEAVVSRSYLIDPQGRQVGNILTNPHIGNNEDPRYKPLQNTNDADWYHCYYLRNALDHPETLQITKPFHSPSVGAMCLTLSQLFKINDLSLILCCDIFAEAMH